MVAAQKRQRDASRAWSCSCGAADNFQWRTACRVCQAAAPRQQLSFAEVAKGTKGAGKGGKAAASPGGASSASQQRPGPGQSAAGECAESDLEVMARLLAKIGSTPELPCTEAFQKALAEQIEKQKPKEVPKPVELRFQHVQGKLDHKRKTLATAKALVVQTAAALEAATIAHNRAQEAVTAREAELMALEEQRTELAAALSAGSAAAAPPVGAILGHWVRQQVPEELLAQPGLLAAVAAAEKAFQAVCDWATAAGAAAKAKAEAAQAAEAEDPAAKTQLDEDMPSSAVSDEGIEASPEVWEKFCKEVGLPVDYIVDGVLRGRKLRAVRGLTDEATTKRQKRG